MARIRRLAPPPLPAGVPVELSSRHHPLWRDAQACEALADAHGLVLNLQQYGTHRPSRDLWWARFDTFREAWCRANALTDGGHRIDARRAGAAGVDMSTSSRFRIGHCTWVVDDGPIRLEHSNTSLGSVVIAGRWDHPHNRKS